MGCFWPAVTIRFADPFRNRGSSGNFFLRCDKGKPIVGREGAVWRIGRKNRISGFRGASCWVNRVLKKRKGASPLNSSICPTAHTNVVFTIYTYHLYQVWHISNQLCEVPCSLVKGVCTVGWISMVALWNLCFPYCGVSLAVKHVIKNCLTLRFYSKCQEKHMLSEKCTYCLWL